MSVPGLAPLANVMPRRIQQIPGLGQGGIGWQGIVPSRAAKMGSIAVDKGISKLGSPGDFYRQLDPEAIAEQILATARGEIHDVVERIMERERPQLWHDLPPRVRAAVHARVEEQLPQIVRTITEEIGTHADDLIDVKLMVIRRLEANPALANRIFLEVGRKELRFIVRFGFFFGLLLGIPTAYLTEQVLTWWWVLPIAGVLIGYTTNLIGIRMIFEPVRRADRALRGPGALPQAPARGGRGLRRHHRRRRGDDDQRRRGPDARPELGSHATADRGLAAPRRRPGPRPGTAGGAGRGGQP